LESTVTLRSATSVAFTSLSVCFQEMHKYDEQAISTSLKSGRIVTCRVWLMYRSGSG